jgi:hypothetical protein
LEQFVSKSLILLLAVIAFVCVGGAQADTIPLGAIVSSPSIVVSYDAPYTFQIFTFGADVGGSGDCLENCKLSFSSSNLVNGQNYFISDDNNFPGKFFNLGYSLGGSWVISLNASSSYTFYFFDTNGDPQGFDLQSFTFSGDFTDVRTHLEASLPATSTAVPEPGSLVLLGSGLVVLVGRLRKNL